MYTAAVLVVPIHAFRLAPEPHTRTVNLNPNARHVLQEREFFIDQVALHLSSSQLRRCDVASITRHGPSNPAHPSFHAL